MKKNKLFSHKYIIINTYILITLVIKVNKNLFEINFKSYKLNIEFI